MILGLPKVMPPSVDRLIRTTPVLNPLGSVDPSVLTKTLPLPATPATGSVARKYGPPVTVVRPGIRARDQVKPPSLLIEYPQSTAPPSLKRPSWKVATRKLLLPGARTMC